MPLPLETTGEVTKIFLTGFKSVGKTIITPGNSSDRLQNLLPDDHALLAEKPNYKKVEMPFLVSEMETTRSEIMIKAMG